MDIDKIFHPMKVSIVYWEWIYNTNAKDNQSMKIRTQGDQNPLDRSETQFLKTAIL